MTEVNILQLPDRAQQESFDPELEGAFTPGATRQVQVLLWDHVKTLLQEAEREEVKRALGAAAIEENEQLFREAASLDEILGDLQRGGEKQAEVQRLFETPARSLVEDEVRLLLDALHHSSSDAASSQADDSLYDASQEEPHKLDESDPPDSPSESFYSIRSLAPKQSKATSSIPEHPPTASSSSPSAYTRLPAAYASHNGLPSRRDCHSAPIPVQSAKDKQILEYLTTRPASSGSIRPRTSDGRSLLRPGTAHLPRPGTAGRALLYALPRPQTAGVSFSADGFGRSAAKYGSSSPGWDRSPGAISNGLFPEHRFVQNSSSLSFCTSLRQSSPADEAKRSTNPTLDSVEGVWGVNSRPGSHWGRPASQCSDNSDRGVGMSRPRTGSSIGGHQPRRIVETIADQLNVFEVEAVAAPLRAALADELAALLDDIDYLRQLIDQEADSNHKASRPPPSIKDLRDYGARLEASLRAHISEAKLRREPGRGSPALSKEAEAEPRDGRHSLRNVGEECDMWSAERVQKGETFRLDCVANAESVKPNGVDGQKTTFAKACEVVRYQGKASKSNGVSQTGVKGRGRSGMSSFEVSEIEQQEQPRYPLKTEAVVDERWTSSTGRSSAGKVQRLRGLVMDSQTEASGAASLCRAEIS